jgi:hypothetical protein
MRLHREQDRDVVAKIAPHVAEELRRRCGPTTPRTDPGAGERIRTADLPFTSSRTPPGYLGATWIPRSVLVLYRPGSSGPLAALVAARSHLGPENLPGVDAASCEYRMDQLAEVAFFPWPEYSGLSCDRFERLDQPVGVDDEDLRSHRSGSRISRQSRFEPAWRSR